MKTFSFFALWLASCVFCMGAGTWNGVAATAWNGVAATSWNGTSISFGAGGGGADWTNLVSYLQFDEASGTRADEMSAVSLSENGGTISAGTGLVYGNAADFERDDGYYLRDNGGAAEWHTSDGFTICVWVNAETLTDSQVILSTDNSNSFVLRYRTAPSRFRWECAGINQDISTTINTATWYFLCVGYDDSDNTMFISVDGVAKTSQANASSRNNSATTLVFGASADANHWDGLIGPACLFSEILIDARIANLYNSGAGRAYP